MPIERRNWISRSDLWAEPKALFLFGDNLARKGLGGQAKEMRGEPNAVGCPTKRLPSMAQNAFFSDADFEVVKTEIDAAFTQLAEHLKTGGTVVLPAAGIGNDRAQLPTRAPRIYRYISRCFERLDQIAAEQHRTQPAHASA